MLNIFIAVMYTDGLHHYCKMINYILNLKEFSSTLGDFFKMVQKKKTILYNKTFLAWFWLCQMHSELYEVTATAAGFTLGVWVLSCSLFRYWLRDFSGETGTRKQCPSNIKRIVQEENYESGRSQPTPSLSSADDLLSRKKRRIRRRKRKRYLNASGDFFFYFYDICACLLTLELVI